MSQVTPILSHLVFNLLPPYLYENQFLALNILQEGAKSTSYREIVWGARGEEGGGRNPSQMQKYSIWLLILDLALGTADNSQLRLLRRWRTFSSRRTFFQRKRKRDCFEPSQSKEYVNQTTKYAISIKRMCQSKHQLRRLITCWIEYVNLTP